MKKLLFILMPTLMFSQVGINTSDPKATLEIRKNTSRPEFKGDLFIETVEDGDLNDYVLVWRNGQVRKITVAQLQSQTPTKCPDFVRSQSDQHYLLFKSTSSIPNPNDPLVIETRNFTSAGTWVQNNLYYFSYSNTSGSPLNVDARFTVYFGTQKCVYNEN